MPNVSIQNVYGQNVYNGDVANKYDTRHAADKRSVKRFRRIDKPQIQSAANAQRVLEIGVGTGRLLSQIKSPKRIGIDISEDMLRARKTQDWTAIVASGEALPFCENSFDCIVSGKGVFRYLDYAKTFKECHRVLTPGGRLAVHQYSAQIWRPFRGLQKDDHTLHLQCIDELTNPAIAAGFAVTKILCWRTIPWYPYVVRTPTKYIRNLWNHCVILFTSQA